MYECYALVDNTLKQNIRLELLEVKEESLTVGTARIARAIYEAHSSLLVAMQSGVVDVSDPDTLHAIDAQIERNRQIIEKLHDPPMVSKYEQERKALGAHLDKRKKRHLHIVDDD